MPVNFTRSLGEESGVQLNPLVDGSDIPIQGAGDQNFAIAMRCLRGRVDRPFSVSSDKFYRKMGYGEPMRVNEINEAWVQVFEALNNGAKNAIIQRLVADDYKNNWLSFNISQLGGEQEVKEPLELDLSVVESSLAIGESLTLKASVNAENVAYAWYKDGITLEGKTQDELLVASAVEASHGGIYTVVAQKGTEKVTASVLVTVEDETVVVEESEYKLPESRKKRESESLIPVTLEELLSRTFEISIKHHECFNDGISISVHADEERNEESELTETQNLRIRIYDSRKNKLFEFSGSLNPSSKDDFGASNYLPDMVELMTDDLELRIDSKLESIPVDSAIYGYDSYGQEKWVTTDVIQYFDEGTIGGYTTENYYNACVKLEQTEYQYKYLASGGNKNAGLITQLAELAYRTNRQFRFDAFVAHNDIPYTVDELTKLMKGLYGDFDPTFAHLVHVYWTPLKCQDPTGVNGRIFLGTSLLNIALACKRNGMKNAQGFAPKNYPIAGKSFPVNRRGVTQIYTPSQPELSQLAVAKINPVIYESYETGGLYIFKDSLTCAPVTNSLRKLIAVAEMSTSVDDAVTSTAKAFLQFPMDVAVKNMANWLQTYFEGVQTANWIVPSNDPQMGGASFRFEVMPNELRPYDQMEIKYWVRYDGTNRQTFVTQTLTK